MADGAVQAAVADGHRVYIGGGFDYIGPATGPAQLLNGETGALLGAPVFDGPVLAIVPDGEGGWFVGGEFAHAGGLPRASLAHIVADGSVDPDWAPAVTGAVLTLARSDRTLYVGGNFSSVGGRSRNRLAAVDTLTAEVVPGFDPDVGFDGVALAPAPPRLPAPSVPNFAPGGALERARDFYRGTVVPRCFDPTFNLRARNDLRGVEALAVRGNRLYAGGSFTSVSGFERRHLAALDASTGQVDESFDPDAATPGRNPRALSPRAETNGPVKALLLVGDRLYAGGNFTSAVGRSRSRLAAFSAGDGALVPGFDPAADRTVRALAAEGDRLYVGGAFRLVGGAAQHNLAALDLATGTPDSAFRARVRGTVNALATGPEGLYAGGRFMSIAGVERPRLAAVSLQSGALVDDFEANADGGVAAIGAANGRVLAAGYFRSIGGLVRHGLAALDTRPTSPARLRGQPDPSFAPAVAMSVRALALGGRRLYASGFPDASRGGRIFAFERPGGASDPLFRAPRGAPDRLLVAAGRLYVGGREGVVSGVSGPLAALERRSGKLDRTFAPHVHGAIGALAAAGRGLYAGGTLFSRKEGRRSVKKERFPRSVGLVRLRGDGSRIRSFRPRLAAQPRTVVLDLARAADRLYATGRFRTLGATSRPNLAAFDLRNGAPIAAFDPPPLAGSALELAGDRLFVNRVPGRRPGVTRLDSGSGARARSFKARLAGSACALAATADALAVGGGFRSLNARPDENLGLINLK